MKNVKSLAVILTITVLASCNSENLYYEQNAVNNSVAVEEMKSNLAELNASYIPSQGKQKRMPKWLRWLIFGAADVAGGIWGGVSGACAASTLAWSVTKPEMKSIDSSQSSTQNMSALKENNLQGIEEGTVGYVHNAVISSVLVDNEEVYEMSNEEVINLVFQALEDETGNTLSEAQKSEVRNSTNTIINSFDANKSVEEFFSDLKLLTTDQQKKDALEVCGLVLDGLQYVDDNDTTYVKAANEIITNSTASPELKSTLLDGVSVANASAKLWNTDGIASLPATE